MPQSSFWVRHRSSRRRRRPAIVSPEGGVVSPASPWVQTVAVSVSRTEVDRVGVCSSSSRMSATKLDGGARSKPFIVVVVDMPLGGRAASEGATRAHSRQPRLHAHAPILGRRSRIFRAVSHVSPCLCCVSGLQAYGRSGGAVYRTERHARFDGGGRRRAHRADRLPASSSTL